MLKTMVAAALLAAAAAAAQEAPRAEGQRMDERRPDAPLRAGPFELGGSWEYGDERRTNFDLDRNRARDRRVREHELKLDARARPAPDTEVLLQLVGLHETRHTQGTAAATVTKSLERGQAWIRLNRLGGTPWALQAGRQALLERRSVWWDDDVDALRLIYDGDALRLQAGHARQLGRVSSAERGVPADERRVARSFLQGEWRWASRQRLTLFALRQDDRSGTPAPGSRATDEDATDPSDLRATWWGLRATGEWRSAGDLRLAWRAEGGWLAGRERVTAYDDAFVAGATTEAAVRGRMHDVGLVLTLPVALRPSVGLAHARASAGFRQTGLQENKSRVAGVKRVRHWGELLQPELSNLAVQTVSGGIRLLGNSSLELLHHRYRQPVAADAVAGARLSADPEGSDRRLGDETDLVLALREWERMEFTLRWSRLRPGPAFAPARRDAAHALELGAALNF